MAIEANIVPGGRRYRIRTAEERARAFRSAERHTRFVAILRKGLPVLAVVVLAAYFISAQLSVSIGVGDLTASIDGIEIADGNLRMTNPKLEGADKKNGKYVIGAEYADQDMKAPNIVKLHAIKAELSTLNGGWSRMDATRGVFDNIKEVKGTHFSIIQPSDRPDARYAEFVELLLEPGGHAHRFDVETYECVVRVEPRQPQRRGHRRRAF